MSLERIDRRRVWRGGPQVGAIGLGCMGMTWAYAPLGRGFLTGRFRDASFAAGDYRGRMPRFQEENLEAVAARHDATAAQVALAWTLAQGEHASAADLRLTADDLADLDALPTPAGARY